MLINQATGFIETYCKRNFLRQTYTNEVYDGTGGDSLVLKQYPIVTVSDLSVNAGTIGDPDWDTVESGRYGFYDDGRITFASAFQAFLASDGGTFIEGPQRYRATYVAGYLIDFNNENDPTKHTLPQDLEYACLLLVSGKMNLRKSGGLTSARVGDISMTFRDLADGDPEVKAILERYTSATI